MAPGNDLGNNFGVVVPNGCQIEGVGFYESDGTLKVAQPIYQTLSATNRAAFILHEAIYKLARETGDAKDSEGTRKLVAAMFSVNNQPQAVLDQARKLIYCGRGVDSPRDTSRMKINDLANALEDHFNNRAVRVPLTNPIGCNVKWDGKDAHWMPAEACDLV